MGTVKILQVVGYKNSGKTTLISRWVRLLRGNGLSVAVLKHHGHGGKPLLPNEATDTMKFYNSGANVSVVAGGGAVQAVWNNEPSFQQLVKLATFDEPDVLLIEGYKQEDEQKVVLLRNKQDWIELQKLTNMKLVVGNAEIPDDLEYISSREQVLQLDAWLLQWVGKD